MSQPAKNAPIPTYIKINIIFFDSNTILSALLAAAKLSIIFPQIYEKAGKVDPKTMAAMEPTIINT